VAEATPRQCPNDPWDQVGTAKGSVEASAVASEVDSVGATGAIAGSEVAATLAVGGAVSVEDSVVDVGAIATLAAAEAATVAGRTVTLRPTLPTGPAAVSAALAAAATGETFPDRAVGIAVTVVVAHMMTDPEATEATVAAEIAAEIAAATGTLDRQEAIWSRCARAGTMDTAAETTSDPEMKTRASVATKAATRIPENCAATNETLRLRCLVVGISGRFPHLSVSDTRASHPPFVTRGKPALILCPEDGRGGHVRLSNQNTIKPTGAR